MSIAILSEDVIARIAAGEVVERPASVVKELIENSIDASADAIHVEIVASGRQLIRISDNGSGIRSDEIELAFKRHATSKLRDSADLEYLATLGFRGEALASISAVSQTTIITRQRDEKMGISLKMNGGAIQHHKAVGAPAGTVITIENLFFNTPARLKFLKSDNTEKRHITTVVTRYAMAYPNVRFVLRQDGREQFRSSGSGELSDVVVKVFGLDTVKRMIEVSSEEVGREGYPKIEVFGYVSEPSLNRNDRSRIIVFINGRAIQDNSLNHAVTQAYHTMMDSGRYPFAVLLLTMPTDFVDVNVHPTKAEVRFRDANQVFVSIQRAVRRAILDFSDKVLDTDKWSSSGFSGEYIEYRQQTNMPLQSPDYGKFRDYNSDDADLDYIPEGAGSPDKPRTLPVLRVVGQIGAAYIIAEGPAGMYLIDQNAAHERILYEQIVEDVQSDSIKTIAPQDSVTLTLSPEDATTLTDLGDEFAQLGFEIEVFGPNTFVLRSMPQVIASPSIEQSLAQILSFIRKSGKTLDNVVLSLAVVCALKNGQILQQDEMQSIVRQLERCPSPHNSPTGQATMIHMSRDHLAKEFRRS